MFTRGDDFMEGRDLLDSVKDRAPKRYVLDAYYSLYSYRIQLMHMIAEPIFDTVSKSRLKINRYHLPFF